VLADFLFALGAKQNCYQPAHPEGERYPVYPVHRVKRAPRVSFSILPLERDAGRQMTHRLRAPVRRR
jgi:hypothetical protein